MSDNQKSDEHTAERLEKEQATRSGMNKKIWSLWILMFFFAIGWGFYNFAPVFIKKFSKESVLLVFISLTLCGLPNLWRYFWGGGLAGLLNFTSYYNVYSDGRRELDTAGTMGSMLGNLLVFALICIFGFFISLIRVAIAVVLVPVDFIVMLTRRVRWWFIALFPLRIILPLAAGIFAFIVIGTRGAQNMVVMDWEGIAACPLWFQQVFKYLAPIN